MNIGRVVRDWYDQLLETLEDMAKAKKISIQRLDAHKSIPTHKI